MKRNRWLGTTVMAIAAFVAPLAAAPSASAASTDSTCTGRSAQYVVHTFTYVHGFDNNNEYLRCGYADSWGWRHIVKTHNAGGGVKADALQCMQTVLRYGDWLYDPSTGKTTTIHYDGFGDWAKVVTGNNGVITAYPQDGGTSTGWFECSFD